MNNLKTIVLILIGLTIGLFAGLIEVKADDISYCQDPTLLNETARLSPDESLQKADRIVISKDQHKLYLMANGRIQRDYSVSFGFGFLKGAKHQEGDGRTPEGHYKINFKNGHSKYHLAMRLSYPEKRDLDYARKLNVKSGSDIMIHGLPGVFTDNLVPAQVQRIHTLVDWTQGCIAVTDPEIEEIFSLVDENIDVEICPLTEPRP